MKILSVTLILIFIFQRSHLFCGESTNFEGRLQSATLNEPDALFGLVKKDDRLMDVLTSLWRLRDSLDNQKSHWVKKIWPQLSAGTYMLYGELGISKPEFEEGMDAFLIEHYNKAESPQERHAAEIYLLQRPTERAKAFIKEGSS